MATTVQAQRPVQYSSQKANVAELQNELRQAIALLAVRDGFDRAPRGASATAAHASKGTAPTRSSPGNLSADAKATLAASGAKTAQRLNAFYASNPNTSDPNFAQSVPKPTLDTNSPLSKQLMALPVQERLRFYQMTPQLNPYVAQLFGQGSSATANQTINSWLGGNSGSLLSAKWDASSGRFKMPDGRNLGDVSRDELGLG